MQEINTSFHLEEKLQKINNTACKIGKIVKRFVKFFIAVLLFAVVNILLALLFNVARPVMLELFNYLDQSGMHVIFWEDLVFIFSVVFQYRMVIYSLAFVVITVSLFVTISDDTTVTSKCKTTRRTHRDFAQRPVCRTSLFSFKQHVAFLS